MPVSAFLDSVKRETAEAVSRYFEPVSWTTSWLREILLGTRRAGRREAVSDPENSFYDQQLFDDYFRLSTRAFVMSLVESRLKARGSLYFEVYVRSAAVSALDFLNLELDPTKLVISGLNGSVEVERPADTSAILKGVAESLRRERRFVVANLFEELALEPSWLEMLGREISRSRQRLRVETIGDFFFSVSLRLLASVIDFVAFLAPQALRRKRRSTEDPFSR